MSLRDWTDVDNRLAEIDSMLTEVDEGCAAAREILPAIHVTALDKMKGAA